jgi:hypothetical protein
MYLPKDVMDDLRQHIPERKRTEFIASVLRRELRKINLQSAIRSSYGAWRMEDHPDLDTPEAIDRWIEENRSSYQWDRPLDNEV